MKHLEHMKCKKILDVGCGPGLFSAPLALQNYLVGLDVSSQMLRLAGDSFHPVLADAVHLPFSGNTFDVVLAIETLQHSENSEALISEVCRVVKPGGQVILFALNRSSILHRCFMRWRKYEGLHFHDLQKVHVILGANGAAEVQTQFLGFPLPLSWGGTHDRFHAPMASSWVVSSWKR